MTTRSDAGRRAATAVATVLVLAACASRAAPLRLPAGHPADPETPGIASSAPQQEAAPSEPAPADESARTYVCPMHPDVTSPAPGKCPRCGMPLRAVPDAPKPAHEEHR